MSTDLWGYGWREGPEPTFRLAMPKDYRGGHRPGGPEHGAPFHDLNQMWGEDIYEHPEWYDSMDYGIKNIQRQLNQARGNPDHPVVIYRAMPSGKTDINTGDWVTTSLPYARQHAMQSDNPDEDWPVVQSTVPAKHVWTNNDLHEWGYHGPSVQGEIVHPDHHAAARLAMPWYHRTDDELNPGDHLLPYNEVNPDNQEIGDESWNPNKAYIYDGEEDNSSDHAPYAGYGRHIYEIEPHSEPERDYGDGNYSSHMIDRGTVVKKLPEEEHDPDDYDRGLREYRDKMSNTCGLSCPANCNKHLFDYYGFPHTAARLATVSPGSTIFRGINLADFPDDLKTRAHQAIDGSPDPRLHDDLLNHVDYYHGFSGWWTDDPDNAKHYAAGGHQDDNPLRAVLATDWDGEGQDYDYTDDEIGDDDVPLRDEPPRPHTVWVGRPGSGWVNVSRSTHTAARLAMPAPLPEGVTFHHHDTDDTIPRYESDEDYAYDDYTNNDEYDDEYDDEEEGPPQRFYAPAVEARHNGNYIGHLEWNYDSSGPTVSGIHVEEPHRRHGIGTALFDFAREHEPELQHSDSRSDLGEKWVAYEQSRTASADDPDFKRWQQGGCLEYAHALQRKFPHLSGGTLYGENGPVHHFVHDDDWAYDSLGRHPMPYHGIDNDFPDADFNDDLGYYDEPDEDEIAAAREHIDRHGIGPHTAVRLAMPWQDWAPEIEHFKPRDKGVGFYSVNHGGNNTSDLSYSPDHQNKTIDIGMVKVDRMLRGDGIAEALIRRMVNDHPGYRINPGFMTDDGQGFHDRMLTKEPSARDMLARLAMPAPLPDEIKTIPFKRGDEIAQKIRGVGGWPTGPGIAAFSPDRDEPIGYIDWHVPGDINEGPYGLAKPNEVHNIEVHPDYRHQSVATALWDHARAVNPDVRHSPDRTPEGESWVRYEQNRNNPKEAQTMTAAVTVYTKPACPQCDMTKKVLDRLGIEHDEVDVTADPDAHAYVTGLGYSQAPVVVVNGGETHWAGFSPDKLKGLVE